MRLLERERRADSSTSSAVLPTRTTQASNFSLERRLEFSEVIGTGSMPNWRKHSESTVLDDSCRSTNAARAENFLEEDSGVREFPKAVSVRMFLAQEITGFPVRASYGTPGLPSQQLANHGSSVEYPFWRGISAISTVR